MTQEEASGQAVAERVRAADIAVGGNSSVEAMLANSLRERKPLADDGALYDTVQAAENAASSFVFVPPGTFSESVTIDTAGLTLLGSGRASLIDGSASTAVVVDASNVSVENLSVKTTGGGGNTVHGVDAGSSSATDVSVKNIVVRDSDTNGVNATVGSDWTIHGVVAETVDNNGINVSVRSIIAGCIIENTDNGNGIANTPGDDRVIANNIVRNTAGTGISIDGNDNIVLGNRVISAGNDGIRIGAFSTSVDNIIGNNRVSGSTNADINDSGTGTTLDANLTGAAN